MRRAAVYREIQEYSYADYLQKFLVPYYWARGIELGSPEALASASSLRTYADGLRANPNVRLIVNQNDFLLPAEDLAWLKTTFAADRLTVFEQGGHLGNLSHPEVQKAILAALAGLQSAPPKPR
jgi:pimeloyl-ACP methyl ester carboxylesterase